MVSYSVVLFDLDGTLIDTNHLIIQSFQHVLRSQLGLEVPANEIYPFFGEPLGRTLARWSAERAESLVSEYRAFNMTNHDRLVTRFPGINEMVESLAGLGTTLAVVTSKGREAVRRGLQVTGLASHFSVLVGLEDTDRHKPEPDPALRALELLGERPGPHVLMVGDSRFDVLCGRNAGLHTAVVGWTTQGRDQIDAARPDYWVETPQDLLSLVSGSRPGAPQPGGRPGC